MLNRHRGYCRSLFKKARISFLCCCRRRIAAAQPFSSAAEDASAVRRVFCFKRQLHASPRTSLLPRFTWSCFWWPGMREVLTAHFAGIHPPRDSGQGRSAWTAWHSPRSGPTYEKGSLPINSSQALRGDLGSPGYKVIAQRLQCSFFLGIRLKSSRY